jgi:hypothetical protein
MNITITGSGPFTHVAEALHKIADAIMEENADLEDLSGEWGDGCPINATITRSDRYTPSDPQHHSSLSIPLS